MTTMTTTTTMTTATTATTAQRRRHWGWRHYRNLSAGRRELASVIAGRYA